MKAEFDVARIDIARRVVRVAISGSENADDLPSEQRAAIEAVATDVASQEQEKMDQAAQDGAKK